MTEVGVEGTVCLDSQALRQKFPFRFRSGEIHISSNFFGILDPTTFQYYCLLVGHSPPPSVRTSGVNVF